MKKLAIIICVITTMCLSGCSLIKKDNTSVTDEVKVESTVDNTEETNTKLAETTTAVEATEESESEEVETTQSVGNIDEIELFKTNPADAKEITDGQQKTEIMSKITEAMSINYDSYTYKSNLSEEFIETDKQTYGASRFIQEKTVEGKRDKKVSYMHTIDNSTYIGKQNISDIEVYLFDKGENTYSYSKRKEDKDWLGAIVARDLETETVNFSWLYNNLDLANASIKEEKLNSNDVYTVTCETSLVFALNTSEVDLNFKKVDSENELANSVRVPIKIYIDKHNNYIVKIEIAYRKALQEYYNIMFSGNAESSIIMDARKGKYSIEYSEYNKEYELDIPEKVKDKMSKNIVDETVVESQNSETQEETKAD